MAGCSASCASWACGMVYEYVYGVYSSTHHTLHSSYTIQAAQAQLVKTVQLAQQPALYSVCVCVCTSIVYLLGLMVSVAK
jgi:hypothetical protein